jgi:WD40 repeat protein
VAQIEAHAGSVNDLAFSYPNKQLCVVTCGDDRVIKVGLPCIFNGSIFFIFFIFLSLRFTAMGLKF